MMIKYVDTNIIIMIVLPKIQANLANAADALMLDTEGFVSETNATNVFLVKGEAVKTPHADYCLPGKILSNPFDYG
jgi:branched-subunit amino acid aminotransferase/4-amino-4-deoxychorismate lyase